jgi:stage V sporulation protein AB
MWIKYALLAVFGLGCGAGLAGGFFSLIIALGIISRFAYQTRTAKHILLYEDMVALGGCFGTYWYLYEWRLPLGFAALLIYGSFAGIFLGAWAMALTEIIDTIPIFMRRIYLRRGLVAAVWGLALGHTAGSLFYYYLWR